MLNIKKVIYNEDFTSGCETCDYGSSYVNEIEIILEDETNAKIKVDRMYEYSLSESDYMKLISNSKTIDDFILNTIGVTISSVILYLVHKNDYFIKVKQIFRKE